MASQSASQSMGNITSTNRDAVVYVVDDDAAVRGALSNLFRSVDLSVETFSSAEDFLAAKRPDTPSCLILDVRLRNQNGLAFHQQLKTSEPHLPVIFMTGHGDIEMSVKAMKDGALDFFAKPFREQDMLDAVSRALAQDAKRLKEERAMASLRLTFESLSSREKEVLRFVLAGLMSKQIAGEMGLSEITVKVHRGHIMRKMNSRSMPDLVRKAEMLGVKPHNADSAETDEAGRTAISRHPLPQTTNET